MCVIERAKQLTKGDDDEEDDPPHRAPHYDRPAVFVDRARFSRPMTSGGVSAQYTNLDGGDLHIPDSQRRPRLPGRTPVKKIADNHRERRVSTHEDRNSDKHTTTMGD